MKNSLLSALFCFLLVDAASAQINLSFSTVPPTCFGYTNGSATVTPSGGSGPYTYLWQNGQTGAGLIGVAAGQYTVTVTDAVSNTASGSVTVTQPEQVAAEISANNLACNGQSGTLTVVTNGGMGNYTYLWSNNATSSSIQITAPGNYFVTVADQNQCNDVANFQVPGALAVTLDITPVRCMTDPNSGALHVNATGATAPYSYLWNDGNTQSDRQNLPPGTYTVVVTAANGCTASASATLTMPPPLTATVLSVSPSCGGGNNGSATITVVGGTPPYTHLWTPGGYTGTTVTGLAPGQYYVCTFDANQCQLDLWVMIPEINNLAVNLNIQSAECPGVNDGVATALVNPPGNYQYQWNLPPFSGVTQITGIAPNTLVSVTVTDPLTGCTGVDSAVVGAHNNIFVAVTDTDIPCAGQNIGTATATASGGTPQYNYVWTAPPGNTTIGTGPNINGLAAGAYMVSVTDSRGCTVTGVANIGILSSLNAQIGGFTTLECGEDSTLLQFENLSTDTLSTITSFTWIITAQDGAQQVFDNVNLLQIKLPVGDTIAALLVVHSAAGCVDSAFQQLIVPGIPQITLSTGPSVALCLNTPVYIEVSGGQPNYNYTWSPLTGLTLDTIPPNVTAFPDTTTTYQLITNNQGCADTVKVQVIRVTPIDLSVDQPEIHTCDGSALLQAFSNVSNVIWVDPAGNPVGNPPGNPVLVAVDSTTTFTAIATDVNGCADSIQVTVFNHPVDVAIDPAFPGIGCSDMPIPLGLINNNIGDTLQYTWTVTAPLTINDPNSANPSVSGPAGNYVVTVTVSNQFDCLDTLEIPVIIKQSISIQQSITADLCNGLEVQFTNNSGLSGVWDFGDNTTSSAQNPLHTYAAAGQYHVVFTPDQTECTMPWDSIIQVFDTTLAPPVIAHNYVNCINQAQIQFTGASNLPIATWAWTFENGTPALSNLQNPVISFTTEGLITATLVVTDINGCVDSAQAEVEVIFINDEIPDSLSYCNDTTVVFLNGNGIDSTATYLWTSNPPDPSLVATAPNPAVSPAVATTYFVVISQGACVLTDTVTVTPEQSPDISLDPDYPGTGCPNTPITLGVINNIPGQTLTYQWTANAPLTITGANTPHPTVSGPTGSYIVTVTVTNLANCTDMLEVPVVIQAGQSIQNNITADLCDGTNVQFFNNSGLSGVWDFGDNTTSTEQNPVHQYSAAGQYLVTFTPDNAVCTAPWDSLIHVYEAALLPPVITHNYVDCIEQAEIQFNGSSNLPDVSWAWTFEGGTPPVSTEQNPLVTFTEEGTITVKLVVTDINGCKDSSEVEVEVIFINDTVVDSLEFCYDTTVVYLNANGIDSTATYQWTAVPADPNLIATDPNPGVSPEVPTVYTVVISQGAFCSVTYTVTVTPLPGPDVDLDPNFPGIGCANTPIQLGLINNQPGVELSYLWTAAPPLVLTGSTSANPTVSGPSGSYIVTVTVTNLETNCVETLEVPVVIQDGLSIQNDITADLCDGTNVQFFNNSGLSGVWDFGDNTTSTEQNPVHQYSAAGQYLVTFTPDNAVCTAPWDSLIHVYEAALLPPVITHNYVDCIEQAEIQFNGSSNLPDVSWAWTFEGGTPPVSTEQNPLVTFTEEGIITAKLVVTDINGCKDSSEVEVEVIFIDDTVADSLEFCYDTTVVYLNANGFDSTATYQWTAVPADPNLVATDPNPGVSPDVQTVYTVVISQGAFCSVTYTVTVIPLPGPDVDLDPNFPGIGCANTPIQLGLINNQPGVELSYLWTAAPPLVLTGPTSANPTVSGPSGSYIVTVTVTNLATNCAETLEVPVVILDGQSIQNDITADLCDGTNVQFFNNSGLSGVWDFGDNTTSTEQNPVHQYSAAGQYLVTFTPDNAVCTEPWDSLIHVYEAALLPPVITHNYVDCIEQAEIQFNGSSNLPDVSWAWTFEGGTPAVSTGQNPLVTFTEEGTITVKLVVTDINGCKDSSEVEVEVIFINDTVVDSLEFCYDTTVVYLNANGFDSTATYQWTAVPADPNLIATDPNPGVSPDVPTVYTVVISQGAFCSVTYTVTVIPLPGPDVDLDPNFPGIGCANTPIQLGLINNQPGVELSYLWTAAPPLVLTGPTSANPTVSGPSGSYIVTVTVTNLATECVETLEVPVQIDSILSIQQSITADLCDGTNVQFFNNSGLSGVWNFGDNTTSTEQNPVHQYSAAGQYLVTFTPDNAVCTAPWDSLIHVYEAALLPPVITHNYVDCIEQAEIQFNGSSNLPDVSWAWTFEGGTPPVSTGQNPLVTFTEEGMITAGLVVTDINGCKDSSEVEVEVIFINDNIVENIEYCIDSTLLYLNANGFDSTATYQWTAVPADPNLIATDPNPGVSPDVPTVYTVVISQGALCSVTYTVTVTPLPGPDVTLPPDMVVCSDTLINLVATGTGLSYVWSDNLNFNPVLSTTMTLQVQPVSNGIYFVKTTGLNGCYAIDSIKVNNGQVEIEPGPAEHIICAGEEVTLFVTNLDPNDNLTYTWTPNLPNAASQTLTPITDGTYQVVVTDPLTGCSETASFAVQVITIGVLAEITGQDTIYPGESTTLLATPSGNGIVVSYEWSPSDGLNNPNIPDPTATPEQDQTYTVTVTNEQGCTATDDVTVYFRGGQCEEPYIFVPKAFTPNNDSNNDFFIVRGVNITELEFSVWNRWGEKVYYTTDLMAQGWDGTYQGKELTPDSYAWYVRARCGNGAIYEKKGDVTLLK